MNSDASDQIKYNKRTKPSKSQDCAHAVHGLVLMTLLGSFHVLINCHSIKLYVPNLSAIPERPSPPVNLSSSEQTQSSVQLTWEPPLKDGGSPILGYIIERCEEGKDNWIRCNMKPVPELTYKVSSLHLKYVCVLYIYICSILYIHNYEISHIL